MKGTQLSSPPTRPPGQPVLPSRGSNPEVELNLDETKKHWIGVGLVVLVVLLWVGSSFLTKTIMKSFNKPFFLTYLSILSFQVYYIFLVVKDPIFARVAEHKIFAQDVQAVVEEDKPEGNMERCRSPAIPMKSPVFFREAPTKKLPTATLKEIATFGAILFTIYYGAIYLSNMSFLYTTVASSTIMATTNGIFLLFFGLVFGTDKATLIKILAVTISLAGACTLVLCELHLGKFRLAGDLMSFGSSALFGAYSVGLKKLSKDASRVSIPLLFATIGTYSMLTLWPLFILLHFTGVEKFVWPYDLASWASILFNVIFGFLIPTYLWMVAFMLTSPLVVAIGMSCTVPVTLAFELVYSKEVPWASFLAGALVIAGFLLINTKSICPEQCPAGDTAIEGCCTTTT